jgi:hypothetical protein
MNWYLTTTPSRRKPSLLENVAFHQEPTVLGPEAAQFLLQGGEVAVTGEGPVALGREGLLPAPQEALAEVAVAGDLGDAPALLGDEPDGLDLELMCERPSLLRHR